MPSKLRQADGSFVSAVNMAEFPVQKDSATIPTAAGATDVYFTAPFNGNLKSAQISPLTALTANDTNYITFTATNLGLDGLGTTVMLAATAPNTTKATGGVALAVNTARALAVHGTAANLAVLKGQRIKVTATGTGTLANTVTVPTYFLVFERTS